MNVTPSIPLQKAIFTTLRASTALAALIGDRVFDAIPKGALMPYVRIGDDHIVSEPEAGGDFFRCNVTIHVFDKGPGRVQAKRVADLVAGILDIELPVDGWSCSEYFHIDSVPLNEPNGETQHIVVRMQYLLQPDV